MSTLNAWDVVDANNNAAPPDGWPENTMNYSDVNNTGRAVQGTVKRFFGDINGSLQAGGVADAYTVTLNETGYLAYFAGMYFACEIMATNTGASTIDVNGIGVQSITDRAGNALTAGELQNGGIYEFRYDGVNFQLMGTVAGTVNIPSAVLSNSNVPDLVDTDVALNVGAADPDTGQHIEVGPAQIQSKSDATTASDMSIGELGGIVRIGDQSGLGGFGVLIYTDGGIGGGIRANFSNTGAISFRDKTVGDPAASANQDVKLALQNQAGDQAGFIGFTGAQLDVVSNLHGGNVRLRGEQVGGSLVSMVDADPDGAVTLTHNAVNQGTRLLTTNFGVNILGEISADPGAGAAQDVTVELRDGGNRLAAQIGFDPTPSTDFRIDSLVEGGNVLLRAEDAAGVLQTLFSGDPDGAVVMYHDGNETVRTRDGGFTLVGDATDIVLDFYSDDGLTQEGFLQLQHAGSMTLRNQIDSGTITITGQDSGSAASNIMVGDPDDDVAFFDDGTEVARTLPAASGGFEANNTLTGAGFERVLTTSDLSGGGVFDTVNKSTTTSRNTTTTKTADPDLTLTSVTGDRYLVIGMIQWQEAGGTNHGMRWTWASGSGSHLISITAQLPTNASLSTPTMAAQTGSSDINMQLGDSTGRRMPVSIQIETLTGGVPEMQWAQVLSNANNTSVFGGTLESNLVQFKVN